jgi:hypothetical protein
MIQSLRIALVALALCAAGVAAGAHDARLGAITISGPWMRPSPPGAPTAAGYATIHNAGPAPDRLVAASSPDARSVEIHEMTMAGGVMQMRPVSGGLPIGPRQTVSLAPGGYHLMLIGPTRAFHVGEVVPITLTFQRAGSVRVRFTVENGTGGQGGMSGMPGMDMH